MIESLTLASFKSFADLSTVAFAPVTVLAGGNSSGKSTLLQALLLLSQSAGSRPSHDPLELNGFLVNLGTFTELVHRGGRGPVSVGCQVSPVDPLGARSTRNPMMLDAPPIPLQSARIDVTFGRLPSAWQGQSGVQLGHLQLTALAEGEQVWSVEAIRRRGPHPKKAFSSDSLAGDPVLGSNSYRLLLHGTWIGEASDSQLRSEEPVDRPIAGLELRGVIPSRVIYPFDRKARRLAALLRRALTVGPFSGDQSELASDPELLAQYVGFFNSKPVVAFTDRTVEDVSQVSALAAAIRPSQRMTIRGLVPDYVARFRRRPNVPASFERAPLPVHLEEAAAALTGALAQIRHLGPLREAPRPFHSLPTSGDPFGVGRSGEFAAAVLHRHAKTMVTHHLGNEKFDESLEDAVNRWLKAMGVHSGARSVEYGKIGHLLTIDDESVPYYLDLTQVGVGVSQLLPVLVQLLIAPPGSTVVLEQPELHLHPAVQSKLADLLVSCAQSGRQVICETHSEYLVSRLRLLVVKGDVAYGSGLRAYFVDRFDGVSRVREVEFSQGGGIRDWPAGFFDQSTLDAAELINTTVMKS